MMNKSECSNDEIYCVSRQLFGFRNSLVLQEFTLRASLSLPAGKPALPTLDKSRNGPDR
jgi:hypothetical protein